MEADGQAPAQEQHLQESLPDAQHGRRLLLVVALAAVVLDHALHDASLVAGGVGGVHLACPCSANASSNAVLSGVSLRPWCGQEAQRRQAPLFSVSLKRPSAPKCTRSTLHEHRAGRHTLPSSLAGRSKPLLPRVTTAEVSSCSTAATACKGGPATRKLRHYVGRTQHSTRQHRQSAEACPRPTCPGSL